jgi:hypothetical protein
LFDKISQAGTEEFHPFGLSAHAEEQVAAFLQGRGEMDETTLLLAFRAWVREQIARNWQRSP